MNRLFASFFVLYIILCGGPFLYAQVDKPYYVDNSHTVYVPKRTIIYPLSEYSTEKVLRERYADEWSSDYVNTYLLSKKVRVSADINIPVIDCSLIVKHLQDDSIFQNIPGRDIAGHDLILLDLLQVQPFGGNKAIRLFIHRV